MRSVAAAAAAVLALLGIAAGAHAQSLRVLVLPKASLDGAVRPDASLDAKLTDTLRSAGMRVVDLDAALAAQRFAFSDSVQAGKIPSALTVLNADAVASLQLDCSLSSGAVMGSKVKSYYCVLSTKVIRVDSGDVVFANSANWTGHGLNALMAVQGLLDKRVVPAVRADAGAWGASFAQAASWDVDLVVTQVTDRKLAHALAHALAALPGITGARLTVYNDGIAKLALAGQGSQALGGLADELERHPQLPLSITYESPRLLHAEFDHARASRLSTMVMAVVAEGAAPTEVAPDLVAAALANLEYLQIAHSRPLLTTPAGQAAMEERLRAKARAARAPLLTVVSLQPQANAWSAAIKVVAVDGDKVLATAQGQGASLGQATDAAARELDLRCRRALSDAGTRRKLGLASQSVSLVQDGRLVIHAFKVPALTARARPAPVGALELVNQSKLPITQVSLSLRTPAGPIAAPSVPDIGPRARLTLPIPLEALPLADEEYLKVTAEIRYRVGDSYGKTSAIAPLVFNPPATPRTEKLPSGYAEVVKLAVVRFNEGEATEALALFERGHEIYPNARTLRGLGMVEFDLGHFDKAAKYLQQSLEAKERPLNPSLREGVVELLQRARSRVQGS